MSEEPKIIVSPTQLARIEGRLITLQAAFDAKAQSDAANWVKVFMKFDMQGADLDEIKSAIDGPPPTPETGDFNPQSATLTTQE